MTDHFCRAVAEVAKRPKSEQDAIASRLLEELADEENWQRSFASSQDLLERLADQAIREDTAGLTEDLDPDRLGSRGPRERSANS